MRRHCFLMIILVLVLSLSVTFSFMGCKSEEVTDAGEETGQIEEEAGPSGQEEVTEEQVTEESSDTIKVGWLSYSISDDWFKAVQTFAEAEAKNIEEEDGVKFEFLIKDGAGDVETQLKQVDDLITMGDIDIVYFEPIDENAMANAVKKMNDELGIPIGAAGITANGGNYLYVGLDNVAATEQCGEKMISLLNEKYGESNWPEDGIIIEIWGPAGLKITQDRHTGFRNALDPELEKNPGVEVVEGTGNWDPDTAFKVISDLIERHGDNIIGIYTDDDTSATEAAWRALELKDMGYLVGEENHIPIVTYDGTINGMQAVRDKKIDMITEQPAFGYGHLVMRYLYKWHTEGYESLPQPGTTLSLEDLSEYFDENTGVQFWSPVPVVEGPSWDGIWLAPKSPIIPDEVDPCEENQWGNYLYYVKNGNYPCE